MKKYSILTIGILFLVLTVGGIAFAEGGMSGSSDQSGGSSMGTSSDQSGMGSSGTSGTGSESADQSMGQSGTSGTSGAMQAQIDINTASAKELETVPGMTKSMARNIVKYRDQNGPFSSVDDLTKVKGINEKKLSAMRNSLTVGAAGSAAPSSGASQQGTSGMGSESSGAGGTGGMGSESGSGSSDMGTGSSGTSGSGSSSGSSGY